MAKKRTTKKINKETKQLYWILVVMAGLILFFLLISVGIQSTKKFEYDGLVFTKETFGEIPVFHYYRYFNSPNGELIKYNLYLRKDPRKNEIPITGEIFLPIKQTVFISVNSTGLGGEEDECEFNAVAVAGLTNFLRDNGLSAKGAIPDKGIAEENKFEHATCDTHIGSVVILIQKGEKTEIKMKGLSCYIMDIADCGLLDAVEKFEVEALVQARERAGF
tara:strand:- start:1292 stop:1951 length:660 start_codon:yes stop_codon:yes gene_type:complete